MNKIKIRRFHLMIIAGCFIIHLMISGCSLVDSKSYADIKQEWSEIHLDLFKDDVEYVVIPTITSFSDRREPISYFNYQDYTIAVWELLSNRGAPHVPNKGRA